MDAGIDATMPAFSTVMACSTSMMGAIEAAGMIDGEACNLALVGGVDSLSRIQIGLGQRLSDWLRKFQQARSLGQKIDHVTHVQLQGHPAVHPGDRQPHDRPQHGRAHRDHRQGMADRPPGAGRDRAREPPARGGRLGQGLLRRPGDPDGRRQTRHHPAQGHLAGEARAPAAVVRPHQRQGHPDRRQLLAADRRRGRRLGRLVEGPGAACRRRRRGQNWSTGRSARSISASRAC